MFCGTFPCFAWVQVWLAKSADAEKAFWARLVQVIARVSGKVKNFSGGLPENAPIGS